MSLTRFVRHLVEKINIISLLVENGDLRDLSHRDVGESIDPCDANVHIKAGKITIYFDFHLITCIVFFLTFKYIHRQQTHYLSFLKCFF